MSLRPPDKHLYGGLPIEIHSDIDDLPAMPQAIWWRVSPSASQVQARWRPGPDNLVWQQCASRFNRDNRARREDRVVQTAERGTLFWVAGLLLRSQRLSSDHMA